MLRRAASNAYSWWWASHVRTKQSKWLEENLQDIEEKVKYALKLLEDEGDSFAKRAEMYYKRRPELISFVEESFKAYRALAERYDYISKELQNANTTIASVFPEQVPEFVEDDDIAPVSPRNRKTHKDLSNENIPKVPDFPIKEIEATKILKSRKYIKGPTSIDVVAVVKKSGLSKIEAVEEIDKLQKDILTLQTEKEFLKSSYENGLAKYWEIENYIMEKQGMICSLQDEFDESVVIEDEEAQILMSTTALKSCQDKLEELRDKHEKNVKEADTTRKHIRESTEELVTLSDSFLGDGRNHRNGHEKENLESFGEKVNEEFDFHASSCLTITDLADKIDELVNDVINLENMFSSQAALLHRLREEIDDLKAQIRALQKENNSSQTDDNIFMRNKLREMEDKLKGIKGIDQEVEKHGNNIEKHLTQAHLKLSFLSEILKSLKQKGEVSKTTNVPIQEKNLDDSVGPENDLSIMKSTSDVVIAEKDHTGEVNQGETTETPKSETKVSLYDSEKHILSPKSDTGTEDESFLQQLLAHGVEGREKHLLTEYTKVLRNYKEVKKMLDETKTKLKSENIMKDEQVRDLNQKLNLLLKGKSDGDDLQLRAKDKKQDQLFMLICREDSAENAIAGQKHMLSPNERQLGARIDALLGENLNLLVRFSNSVGQIQKFDTGIKDLHAEILKIIEQKNQDGGNTTKHSLRPIYKHLSEIRTELTIWLEKSLLLKEEINFRASTLNDIQKEITEALKTDYEDSEMKFTVYQGAKFEGEVSNMKKENNRIAEELQAGLDQVTKLQHESDKTLEKLSEELSLYESKNRSNIQHSQDRKTRIPLRSFIFDVKPKKQRLSIFSCMQPSMYKKMKPGS